MIAFRDLRQFNVDVRAARRFKLPREARELLFTPDFLNVFNGANIQSISGTPSPFTSTDVYGPGGSAPRPAQCSGPTQGSSC